MEKKKAHFRPFGWQLAGFQEMPESETEDTAQGDLCVAEVTAVSPFRQVLLWGEGLKPHKL